MNYDELIKKADDAIEALERLKELTREVNL